AVRGVAEIEDSQTEQLDARHLLSVGRKQRRRPALLVLLGVVALDDEVLVPLLPGLDRDLRKGDLEIGKRHRPPRAGSLPARRCVIDLNPIGATLYCTLDPCAGFRASARL